MAQYGPVAVVKEAVFGGSEVVESKIALGLVMALEDPHAIVEVRKAFFREVFEGIDVTEGFADFGAIDGDVVIVEPKV